MFPKGRVMNHRLGILAVVTACLILATMVRADDDFGMGLKKYTTKHYIVYTNLDREEAVDYGRHMDMVFREYSRRFSNFKRARNDYNNLFLVRTREDYIKLMGQFGFDASASGGVFFVRQNMSGLATWVEDKPKDFTLETLQHEGFHQFAAKYIGHTLPLWTNEGLAVYFEVAELDKRRLKIGELCKNNLGAVKKAFDADKLIPFAELLNITSNQWHANMRGDNYRGHLQYAQSWSVAYFLIHGDKGKYSRAFERYLFKLSQGDTHREAYDAIFGKGSEAFFEKRWKNFLEEQFKELESGESEDSES